MEDDPDGDQWDPMMVLREPLLDRHIPLWGQDQETWDEFEDPDHEPETGVEYQEEEAPQPETWEQEFLKLRIVDDDNNWEITNPDILQDHRIEGNHW